VEQARAVLSEDGYQKLLGAVHTLRYVTELLEKKEASLADLRELLCPATTEKTEKVLKQAGIDSSPEKPSTGPETGAPKRKARGHGCNGATAQRRIAGRRGPSSACVLKNRRCVPGRVWRQGLSATRARRAGADQRAGAFGRDRV